MQERHPRETITDGISNIWEELAEGCRTMVQKVDRWRAE